MFNSLTHARRPTEAGVSRAQAAAMADAIHQAEEHGNHVTPDAVPDGDRHALRAGIHCSILAHRAATFTIGAVALSWLLGDRPFVKRQEGRPRSFEAMVTETSAITHQIRHRGLPVATVTS